MLCDDLRVSDFYFTLILIYDYRSYTLLGWVGGTFFDIAYIVSFGNVLRILYLCSRTEPGIIPKIRSKQIEYNK